MKLKYSLIAATISACLAPAYADDNSEQPPEVITVKGDFNPRNIQQTPASIALISEQMIRQRNAEHLEDVLNASANVNFSAGASRARFYQIRGIGERSEFVDAINPSVGVTIDGIDYSGLGTVASLFDIEQVEIFRGPQGTRFGSNAMAGMINLHSTPADGDRSGKVKVSLANYNSRQLAIAHGNALGDHAAYRLSLHQSSSDGFIHNRYLNRNDTNGTDELAARLNVHWDSAEDLSIDMAAHHFDIDNGYDSFSLDNNRQTDSDQPGFDRQKTKALGLTGRYSGLEQAEISVHASTTASDLAYGYDEDWTYEGFHDWGYSSYDHYFRDHQNHSLDLRLAAKPNQPEHWISGLYHQQKTVELQRLSVYGFDPLFSSRLETRNSAWYAQRDWSIDDEITLTGGIRIEKHQGDYHDTVATTEAFSDTLWGGKLNTRYQFSDDTLLYANLSRGYKAGGVNGEAIGKAKLDGQDTSADFFTNRTTFAPEILNALELGIKGSNRDQSLSLRFSIFYAQREDVQLKGYATEQSESGNPTIFVGYLENGSSGSNYGLETDINYQLSEQLQVSANIGLLETKVKDFIAQDGTNMHGRAQAHAPSFQYNVATVYHFHDDWFLRANIEGKDGYYYSMSHNAQSNPVALVNLALGYTGEHWQLTLWGRNLFDQTYGVRGFSFANDPRDFYASPHTYTQLSEPARFGGTIDYSF